MSSLCGVDDAPTGDGTLLCLDHATELARELRGTAGVVDDLRTTQRRAARFGSGDQGRRSTVTPVPFDERITPVLAELHYRLSVYSRLNEAAPTAKHAADCLDQLSDMRLDGRGAGLYLSLRSVLGRARGLVDAPEQRRYAGPCGAELQSENLCDVDLYAHPDESWVTCPGCGAHWEIADRRAWLLDKAQDYWATLEEAGGAMTDVDRHAVPVKTLRTWINRGKLSVRGWVVPEDLRKPFSDNVVLRRPNGDDGKPARGYTPLVRVGDVADIVRKRHAAEEEQAG